MKAVWGLALLLSFGSGSAGAQDANPPGSEPGDSGNVEFTEYPVAHQPSGIVAGPDGNLWITENSSNRIGRLTLRKNCGPNQDFLTDPPSETASVFKSAFLGRPQFPFLRACNWGRLR